MANKKAAEKAYRQNIKRNTRNNKIKKEMRDLIKDTRKTLEKSGADPKNMKKIISVIDRAAQKGVIKKNTAARYKSRLTRRANSKVTNKVAA